MNLEGPHDIEVELVDRPGALADFGQILGRVGVSLEGGGVFTFNGTAISHFLVHNADAAKEALDAAGIGPVRVHPVVMLKLDQEMPGQLGAFTRRLAERGINIVTQYSDHDHNLVIVTAVEQHEAATRVAEEWMTR